MKRLIAILLAAVFIFSSFTMSAFAIENKNGITDEWKETVLSNYNEFISEVDGDERKIPMIISTDQHGAVKRNSEVFKYINEITDWSKISKIINLGDTVKLVGNPFELTAYRKATECLPENKRIEIIGNHDGFFLPFGRIVQKIFFPTYGAVKSRGGDAFVVRDEKFNVCYLNVDPMHFPWSYTGGNLSSSQADFIIKELSKNDGSDIVMVSHTYLFGDAMIQRDGTVFTGSDYFIGGEKLFAEVKQSFVSMLAARKNHTAGVLIDSFGRKHPYDFSNCESDFMMTLHGHHHTEGYETKDGITEFLFQTFSEFEDEPNCFYFAYIDREAKTFKCWKNIKGYDAWEISIK